MCHTNAIKEYLTKVHSQNVIVLGISCDGLGEIEWHYAKTYRPNYIEVELVWIQQYIKVTYRDALFL